MQKDSTAHKMLVVFCSTIAIGIIAFVVFLLPEKGNNTEYVGSGTVQVALDKQKNPYRLIAVGDISCPADKVIEGAVCESPLVAKLVKKLDPDAVMLLGDIQYEKGDLANFEASFGKDWSDLFPKLYPVPGNHEYGTKDAAGYFDFFKAAKVDAGEAGKGYYFKRLSDWDLYALNSNCEFIGGCDEPSTQGAWLKDQLEQSNSQCAIAAWHHPRFTSGKYATDAVSKGRSGYFWNILTQRKADVVLNGHDHLFERFALQNADGVADGQGLMQFTVGTGGFSYYKTTTVAENQTKVITNVSGVLQLTLFKESYAWEFINLQGDVIDTGRANCRV